MSFIYEPNADWIQESHIYKFWKSQGNIDLFSFRKFCAENTESFWKKALEDMNLHWTEKPKKILSEGLPFPRWAEGGRLSIVENCIDRHLSTKSNKTALIFEADEPGNSHTWTFQDLARESSYIAHILKEAGAQAGDRVALLMPMSLEMVASFFGVLRAGLSLIPVFSGYGAEAIQTRLNDAEVKFVFVQKKTTRRGKEVPVAKTLESILPACPSLKKVFYLDREEFLKGHHSTAFFPAVPFDAEAECLLLYTSGTTGKPKACVHTSFGVLATTGKEHRYSFDVKESDRFFWYTDIGWMMGPWELFGALQYGATVVLFEGTPDYPDSDRIWNILKDHRVTHFGISPTAIRVLKKAETGLLQKLEFDSLRILGSTGEPWDEESWIWFFENVGKRKTPIINISGGTEIMGCLLSPDPLSPLKPASLAQPALGVRAEVWNENGEALEKGLGHLVCLSPIPSMTKAFLGSRERYLQTYFEKFGEKVWYHGDWAFVDDEGQWFLRGRSDDTIKIAGKRVGPNEFESALMQDPRVAESAAVGIPHDIKGECVYCFVVLKKPDQDKNEQTRLELKEILSRTMGKALAPDKILFVEALPKTRSGKILRGVIRRIILNESYDSSAAENPSALEAVKRAC